MVIDETDPIDIRRLNNREVNSVQSVRHDDLQDDMQNIPDNDESVQDSSTNRAGGTRGQPGNVRGRSQRGGARSHSHRGGAPGQRVGARGQRGGRQVIRRRYNHVLNRQTFPTAMREMAVRSIQLQEEAVQSQRRIEISQLFFLTNVVGVHNDLIREDQQRWINNNIHRLHQQQANNPEPANNPEQAADNPQEEANSD